MIYIIMPTHNRREITRRFIEQLKSQSCQFFMVLFIDDGCTDGTWDAIKDYKPLRRIKGDGTLWWAGAMQKAYKWLSKNGVTDTDMVMIANDDAILSNDFLEKSLRGWQKNTIMMPSVFVGDLAVDGCAYVDWKTGNMGLSKTPNCCSTRCVILSAKDFLRIGRWHPVLLPHYFSDSEWTYRAVKMGIKIIKGENISIILEEDATKSTKLFSIKNPYNPIYHSCLVLLSCPIQHIPFNILKIWYKALRVVLIKLIQTIVLVRIHSPIGKWWSKGAWITLTLNTSCNLRCPDCPLWIGNETFPNWKQCTIEEWKTFVLRLPLWVSLFSICGGEPTLVKWLPEFINWLLERGHHVSIYTNLYNVDILLQMKQSKRLTILATYHHQDDKQKFLKSYNLLKNRYNITIQEFESPRTLPCSQPKEHLKGNYTVDFNNFHCAPNAPITTAIYCGGEDKY
jgi:GT2 family glycosyltransferase